MNLIAPFAFLFASILAQRLTWPGDPALPDPAPVLQRRRSVRR